MAAVHHATLTVSSLLLVLLSAVVAARDLDGANPFPAQQPAGRQQHEQGAPYYGYGGGVPGFPVGGFFGTGGGFYGGGTGGGWGGGYGGHAHGGVEVPTVVCQEKGPCYGKKIACPSKCFWSYSRAGNGYGAGGGGGSCTVDCKYKCAASC